MTTDSNHSDPVAENLLNREFTADAPNRRWVGYSMSQHIDRQLVLGALRTAVGLRRPEPALLHHTDRGSQYTSGDYQRELQGLGMVPSMSRRDNGLDNAVAESFFSSLKVEALHHLSSPTREAARGEVIEYIH